MAISPTTSVRAAALASLAGAAVVLSGMPAQAAPTPSAAPVAQKIATADTKAERAKERKKKVRAKRQAQRERADRTRQTVVRTALKHKGKRYVSGASGPNAFDCSGFTMYVYKKAAGKHLPHYSGAQMNKTKRVSKKNLKPGDLLFYGRGGSQHVSMYIGKGKMIHATNPRSGVKIDSINSGYYKARFAGAGRMIQS